MECGVGEETVDVDYEISVGKLLKKADEDQDHLALFALYLVVEHRAPRPIA